MIEYAAAKYVVGATRRWPAGPDEGRRRLTRTFERFGFHRALRLAGAATGDMVRVGALEVALWDYPPPEHRTESDGPADYDYVVALDIARLAPDALREEARRVAPLLAAKLLRTGD